jgi:hypothetical protein
LPVSLLADLLRSCLVVADSLSQGFRPIEFLNPVSVFTITLRTTIRASLAAMIAISLRAFAARSLAKDQLCLAWSQSPTYVLSEILSRDYRSVQPVSKGDFLVGATEPPWRDFGKT